MARRPYVYRCLCAGRTADSGGKTQGELVPGTLAGSGEQRGQSTLCFPPRGV